MVPASSARARRLPHHRSPFARPVLQYRDPVVSLRDSPKGVHHVRITEGCGLTQEGSVESVEGVGNVWRSQRSSRYGAVSLPVLGPSCPWATPGASGPAPVTGDR